MDFLRSKRSATAFGLGFLLTSLTSLHFFRQYDDTPLATFKKVALYQRNAENIDTIFIGSSRFINAINPELFDSTTSRAGYPTTSFNLGVHGSYSLESESLLKQVLGTPGAQVKHVVLEILPRIFPWSKADLNDDCLDGGALSPLSWANAVRDSVKYARWKDATALAGCLTNRWFAIGSFWRGKDARYTANRRFPPERRGYNPQSTVVQPPLFENYLNQVKEKIREKPFPTLDPFYASIYLRMKTLAEAHGARVGLVRMPFVKYDIPQSRALKDLPIDVIANWGDPSESPEFYERRYYADPGHMNQDGATYLSSALAERFVDWAKEKTPAGETPYRGLSSSLE